MRVAVVHDWLTVIGGAERVLSEILELFPNADLYSVVDYLPDPARAALGGRHARTSFIQRLPFAKRFYRAYLPLMPLAVEQWDFSDYDLVISSCYAVVKGLITGPQTLHVSYVHSPMRYAWDLQGSYMRNAGLGFLRQLAARVLLHRIRLWDQVSAQRVDVLLANSRFVAGRIRKLYRREARVVAPPVQLERFRPDGAPEDYFLTVSRLVPYKRIDMIVEAFAGMPEHRLVVIGDGPEMARVRAKATANVHILGQIPDEQVTDNLQRCRAFVFAAIEDFGISPLEAQACGKPVIALAAGGVLETLAAQGPRPTAVFYTKQTASSLRDAVRHFVANEVIYTAAACRENAERYSAAAFRNGIMEAVAEGMAAQQNVAGAPGEAGAEPVSSHVPASHLAAAPVKKEPASIS